MITTVSTITVTTVTAIGFAATLSVAVTVLLIFFLSATELANATGTRVGLRVSRFHNIAIIPLIMAFAVIVIQQIIQILS